MGCKLGSTCVLLVNKAEIIELITEFFNLQGLNLLHKIGPLGM